MRKLFLLALFCMMGMPLKASLQQGKTLGQEMLNRSGNVATTLNPAQVVPQYTATPQEAKLDETRLNQSVLESVQTHPSARLVKESEQSRGKFLNLHEDPLVTFSCDLAQDPLALLSKFYKDCREVPLEGSASPPQTEQKTCEEAGEPYTLTCTRDLVVKVTQTPPRPVTFSFSLPLLWDKHRGFWNRYFKRGQGRHPVSALDFGGDNKGGDPGYAKHYTYIPNPAVDRVFLSDLFALTGRRDALQKRQNLKTKNKSVPPPFSEDLEKLRIKRVISLPGLGHRPYPGQHLWFYNMAQIELEVIEPPIISPDEWVSSCALLEEKVDSGLCRYVSKTCSQGAQTRLINGTSVTRPCWQETFTYQCTAPAQDDCAGLRHQGCHQVGSRCVHSIGSTCVLYAQTFSCVKPSNPQGKGVKTRIVCGEAPHCLAGDCVEQGYPLNGEMLQVMSQMSVLKELQNQMKDGLPEIFKGQDNRCSRNCVDFKDCCGSEGGWGVSLHLAACSPEEKALSLKRQKKQCHRIGTYCAKKILGVCMEKRTTFCCFGSSFLRTIQEQARRQIGLGWGNAEAPLCRGLTVEELSRVDFSKLDLREIFQELSAKYKQPQSAVMGQKIQTRMQEIQDSLQKNPRARQRGEG